MAFSLIFRTDTATRKVVLKSIERRLTPHLLLAHSPANPSTSIGRNTDLRSSTIVPLLISHRSIFETRTSQSKPPAIINVNFTASRNHWSSPIRSARGLGGKPDLPDIVKVGDPVLHEPAQEVSPEEIGSEKIQKIINDMVQVMRKALGVGLAAPQIGIPLKIIVLEDTNEYISYAPKEETKAQDRRPFDLLVIVNPKLIKKSNKSAFFFEGCLSVDGYCAMVKRFLDVEVTGLDRNGQPIKVNASGWQARILQHEYDHLEGTIYVDKMFPRTFRTMGNLDLPLGNLCPKLGVR